MKRAAKRSAPTRSSGSARPRTVQQVSAGGVAYRPGRRGPEIALIAVAAPGGEPRWQLPKGLVDAGESPEAAALREVREEAGIETRLVAPIETIEYWYVGDADEERVRFHKFVHFFLLECASGDVADHDQEVLEACWAGVDEAVRLLAFDNERRILEQARDMIARRRATRD